MSEEAKNLIVALLNRNPIKRLGSGVSGAKEIMKHPFFEGINWEDIIKKNTKPPKP